jgi:uncharacterized membrane protein YdbT with pleckstrin-like domain
MRSDPYIMPHERRILTLRQHPVVVLLKPLAIVLLSVAFAAFVMVATGHAVGWLAFLAAAGYLAWKAAEWATTYLILTNLRMLVIDGIFTRRVSMIPLVKVVDMNFERPFWGMMFGYGRLVVEGAHDTHPLGRIGPLPQIDQVYAIICSMIFSDPEDREE